MKKLCMYFFLLLSTSSMSQNLVPNPSFEDTLGCPSFTGQINLANGWESYGESPDYYNACSGLFGVPVNGFGNQQAFQGVAYGGFSPYSSNQPNIREYIGRQLSQTLIVGQKYFVSFYVSLADTFSLDCAVNKIGLKFSTVPFSTNNLPPLNDSAHVYTDSILSDKINWTKISGAFIADSAYDYLIIGNFFSDANTDTANCAAFSYYYLDQVCVSTDSLTCSIISGIYPFAHNDNIEIKINPNPADETLGIISMSGIINDIEIYSILGVSLLKTSFNDHSHKVNLKVSNISNGTYFIKILINNNYSICKFQIIR